MLGRDTAGYIPFKLLFSHILTQTCVTYLVAQIALYSYNESVSRRLTPRREPGFFVVIVTI